jgi:hypothetical protein
MRRKSATFKRFLCGHVAALSAAVFASSGVSSPARGSDLGDMGDGNVVRVEEDWALALNEPEAAMDAPQFHSVMSAGQGYFFQSSWNYRGEPEFQGGGMQLQAWSGDSNLALNSARDESLSRTAETVTWTQVMVTDGQNLGFQITNGHSTTWGSFGGDSMSLVVSANLQHLNQYSANQSKSSSWITYGSNRVNSLVIRQVRKYHANGLITIDIVPKVVYQFGG